MEIQFRRNTFRKFPAENKVKGPQPTAKKTKKGNLSKKRLVESMKRGFKQESPTKGKER